MVPTPQDPYRARTPAALVDGRYRLLEPVGQGGMGVVWRAEHVLLHREVAVKLLHPELSSSPELAKRFAREAHSIARLDHPNIVRVLDFGRAADGTLYLAMELLVGTPLATAVAFGPLVPARAVRIAAEVLDALAHAHDQGVVHRDLKPDNVLLVGSGSDEHVKLLDFGIAKLVGEAASTQEALTAAGMVFGTPEYLSPEQAVGEPADTRSDIYGTGVLLYEMLAGRRPFEADSRVALMSLHVTARPPPLHKRVDGVTLALEDVVFRALAKRPEDRYPSAAAMRQALSEAADGTTGVSSLIAVEIKGRLALAMGRASRLFHRLARRLEPLVLRAGPRKFAAISAAAWVVAIAAALALALGPRGVHNVVEDQTVATLANAEQLLAHGQLPSARAVLQAALVEHPDVARVHYLLGNLHFAEGDRGGVLADYREAMRLDDHYRGDEVLLENLRTLADDASLGERAVEELADDVGTPALSTLMDCASTCRDGRQRRAAAEAVARLGGARIVPATDDRLAALLDVLAHGKNCKIRRRAVVELMDLADPRAIAPLRAARERRGGGWFGLTRVNACALREIDEALRTLGAQATIRETTKPP